MFGRKKNNSKIHESFINNAEDLLSQSGIDSLPIDQSNKKGTVYKEYLEALGLGRENFRYERLREKRYPNAVPREEICDENGNVKMSLVELRKKYPAPANEANIVFEDTLYAVNSARDFSYEFKKELFLTAPDYLRHYVFKILMYTEANNQLCNDMNAYAQADFETIKATCTKEELAKYKDSICYRYDEPLTKGMSTIDALGIGLALSTIYQVVNERIPENIVELGEKYGFYHTACFDMEDKVDMEDIYDVERATHLEAIKIQRENLPQMHAFNLTMEYIKDKKYSQSELKRIYDVARFVICDELSRLTSTFYVGMLNHRSHIDITRDDRLYILKLYIDRLIMAMKELGYNVISKWVNPFTDNEKEILRTGCVYNYILYPNIKETFTVLFLEKYLTNGKGYKAMPEDWYTKDNLGRHYTKESIFGSNDANYKIKNGTMNINYITWNLHEYLKEMQEDVARYAHTLFESKKEFKEWAKERHMPNISKEEYLAMVYPAKYETLGIQDKDLKYLKPKHRFLTNEMYKDEMAALEQY